MITLKNIIILMLVSSVMLITGCKKEENPAAAEEAAKQNSSYPAPTSFNGIQPENALVIVRTSVTQAGFTLSTGVGAANLDNKDKGTVTATVSGTTYTFEKMNSNGNISYLYAPSALNPTGGISLGSGQANASFNVTSYSLNANSVTIPGEINITAPAANANVSRSSGLNITWTTTASGTNNAVFIADKNGKSIFKEVTGRGSGTFTAAELSTLSPGTGLVYAITYNYILTNNNDAVLIGEAVAFNNITLQ